MSRAGGRNEPVDWTGLQGGPRGPQLSGMSFPGTASAAQRLREWVLGPRRSAFPPPPTG